MWISLYLTTVFAPGTRSEMIHCSESLCKQHNYAYIDRCESVPYPCICFELSIRVSLYLTTVFASGTRSETIHCSDRALAICKQHNYVYIDRCKSVLYTCICNEHSMWISLYLTTGIASRGVAHAVLPLEPGQKYFTTVRAFNNDGQAVQTTSDGFTVDNAPPQLAFSRWVENFIRNQRTGNAFEKSPCSELPSPPSWRGES